MTLHLDARNQVTAAEIVGVGTLTAALVHPREVFKGAILNNASAIIAGHNHPSGDCSPSREDYAIKERLRASGELLDVPLLDFLVVSGRDYLSI